MTKLETQFLLAKSLWSDGADRQIHRPFPARNVNLETYTSLVHPNHTVVLSIYGKLNIIFNTEETVLGKMITPFLLSKINIKLECPESSAQVSEFWATS